MGFFCMGAGGVSLANFASRWDDGTNTLRFRGEKDKEGVDVADRGLKDLGVSGNGWVLKSLGDVVFRFKADFINLT